MSTNTTGFRWFSKIFASLCFGRKSPKHWKGISNERILPVLGVAWARTELLAASGVGGVRGGLDGGAGGGGGGWGVLRAVRGAAVDCRLECAAYYTWVSACRSREWTR